ncbi:SMC like ABC ATPase [Cryptosporidium ubiquitum]|uniref:Structural maintenance of chromosomes protein 5 n=1 Tax=Cryptosporidium ubiquitum TaxID=857276 RepID=A0A1J4ML24_9CRYT|nr:SMC like ABC ATPase [Cryptosporidium ubiquitum]OII73557.1 SMC like ABC ATPase [Cryptosporidium ubiquitum]
MTRLSKKGRVRNDVRESEYDNEEESIIKNNQESEQLGNGTLISIELENWMNIKGPTKYCFNNGVNIVTGLNGSGKSSVACGIAVSLGYDTHILARGHYLSSYIRNGSTSCKLNIALRNVKEQENRYVSEIERVITIVESNKTNRLNSQTEIRSSWKLNGKKCLERDIIALRKGLNIQLDNMIAFLAQQRVSQFASQSPQEIFIDILRIISNDSIKSRNPQNENKRIDITACWSEFQENNLLSVYYQFLDIFKDSKDCKLRFKDNETRLSQLSNEISKSKENEIKYIQYLLHKMGIYLIHFFQSLNDIANDKVNLINLNERKKKVIKELTEAKKELRKQESESSKVFKELDFAKKNNEEFLKNIQFEKLDKQYKSLINNLDGITNKLQENYRDPKLLFERHRIKIVAVQNKITDTENKIQYYIDQLEKEWKPKLIRCKLYEEDLPQNFDKVTAEKKRKILGESISDISSKKVSVQKNIKEFEFMISKLIEKKNSIKSINFLSNRENILRQKYLRNVNQKALSDSRRENILNYFQKLHEHSRFENYLPKKKVIGPIGSYISVKNLKLQVLVEAFLQQFHYYFVSEREDVKLLTERYRLNVLTLSNTKTPIYPKLDDELRSLGITGFLHEHLEFEDENMKNILYQISAQFFTCVIIDNPSLTEEIQEDEILYKLSDWFKRKYDQPGNKVSNNVHLFITNQNAEDNIHSKNGVLFKIITSIYNPNSKTISMVNLGDKMNTILLDKEIIKEENFEMDQINQQEKSIQKEIEQLELKIQESNKKLVELKEQYDGEIMLLNMITECISNIPSLYEMISKLKKQLNSLEKDLKENTLNESEIKSKNQKLIRSAFMGQDPMDSSEFDTFQTSIFKELSKVKILFEEISTHDFLKNKELSGKVFELSTNYSSIQKKITQNKDEIRQFELKLNQVNGDYDKIISTLEMKRKASIDSYLQYYSTYCQYYKRLKYNEFNKDSNHNSDKTIYEFFYKANRFENNESKDQYDTINGLDDDQSIINVPGVEFFSSIISGNKPLTSNGEKIPSYCIEMMNQVSSEFGLVKCDHSQFEEILNNTFRNSLSSSNNNIQLVGERKEMEVDNTENEANVGRKGFKKVSKSNHSKNLTLFDILLENEEYNTKYNNLFNIITGLEAKTHNTNLERMADLEQEFEILSKENQDLNKRISEYEEFIGKNYNKWLEKLKIIEDVTSHCFGVFMRFIDDRHNGKIIIPFINNFMLFMSNTMDTNNEAIFNYLVENFENDSKLNIMVRFSPDEDLRLFSSNSISGGEQSLCTILFILSLQALCNGNSFKLFDEINQGLDNSREIKLMELLDILTNKEKTKKLLKVKESEINYKKIEEKIEKSINYKESQIIIITPHIFPGVIFENFSIHFVLNGPGFIVN